jgi:hypothetical protein
MEPAFHGRCRDITQSITEISSLLRFALGSGVDARNGINFSTQ